MKNNNFQIEITKEECKPKCKYPECNNYTRSLGYCNKHYKLFHRTGDIEYTNTCYIKECQIKSGYYIPFNTIKLKGVKVEIKEFICIMAIDCENDDLIRLSNLYDIDWKTNNTFKDKNIKDITVKDYNNYIKSISIVSNL